jgi:hypothetical protein
MPGLVQEESTPSKEFTINPSCLREVKKGTCDQASFYSMELKIDGAI